MTNRKQDNVPTPPVPAGEAINNVAGALEKLAQAHANQDPEAPASFSFIVTTPGGFEVLATVRNDQLAHLVDEFPNFERELLAAGYTPVYRYGGPPAPAVSPPPAASTPTGRPASALMPPPTLAPDWQPPEGAPPSEGQPQAAGQPTVSPAPAASASFEAESLVGEMKDNGRAYWKVKGGKYTEFGVRVWDEVLEEAGFDLAALQAGTAYGLQGFTAHYTTNGNGNPKKITELVRS